MTVERYESVLEFERERTRTLHDELHRAIVYVAFALLLLHVIGGIFGTALFWLFLANTAVALLHAGGLLGSPAAQAIKERMAGTDQLWNRAPEGWEG